MYFIIKTFYSIQLFFLFMHSWNASYHNYITTNISPPLEFMLANLFLLRVIFEGSRNVLPLRVRHDPNIPSVKTWPRRSSHGAFLHVLARLTKTQWQTCGLLRSPWSTHHIIYTAIYAMRHIRETSAIILLHINMMHAYALGIWIP